MSPEEFLREFGHLAETEEGVGQLRRLVPSLAATGGLSPTGTEFSERTGSELFQFVTSGSRGWAKYYADDGATFLRIGNLDYQTIELDLESIQCVRPPAGAEGTRTRVRSGDILVSITGDTGMVGVVREGLGEAYINQHVALARPVSGLLPDYLAWSLTSTAVLSTLQSYQRGIKNSLGLEDIRRLKFAVPPLPEQKRIVEKVDQLMALCDELEAKQKQKRAKAVAFNKAALSAVVHAPDKSKLKSSWSRVQDHFEVLYELPENVKELRQTILQLAVMGKLVRQEEGDDGEPPIDSVGTRQGPFALLNGWKWVSLAEIGRTQTGTTPSTKESKYWGQGVPFVTPGDLENFTIRTPNKCLTPDGLAVGREVAPGSILMVCIGGSLGKLAKTEIAVSCNQQINALTPVPQVDCDYVMFALASGYFQAEAWRRAGQGTLPIISKGKWERIPVPLPPSSLQPRISAKIRFIMNMCDDLEVKLAQHRDQGQRLMQAVVEGLVG